MRDGAPPGTPASDAASRGKPLHAPASRSRRLARGAGLALAVLALLDQTIQYTVLADGWLLGRRIAPFDPPLFTPGQEAVVARVRAHVEHGTPLEGVDFDPDLGWAPKKDGGSGDFRFDWAGARLVRDPLQRAKTPGARRVVAVGCSFTLGDEVPAEASWAARVDAARADLEVANLGMGAYGLDQARLRFLKDGVPLAPDEVWLGFLPSAAPRVVTTYLPAMRHYAWSPAFKPRYVLGDGDRLVLIRDPARTPKDFVRLLEGGERFHQDVAPFDAWVRRAPTAYAPRGTSWMHAFATTRLALTIAERGGRAAREFVADPDQECARLVREIGFALRGEVEAVHARYRILVLPDRDDLADARATGHGYWHHLVVAWRERGVDVVDLTPDLLAADLDRDDAAWAPSGHYSARGNEIVARSLVHALGE